MRVRFLLMSLAVAACGKGTDEAHCFLSDLDPDAQITSVEVETTTGSEATDSDIFLVLELSGGTEQGLYLDDAADNFEAFATETFAVPVSPFALDDLAHMSLRKESSLFEGGDWDLEGLMVTFLDSGGDRLLAYDDQDYVEHMTGDETFDMHCY